MNVRLIVLVFLMAVISAPVAMPVRAEDNVMAFLRGDYIEKKHKPRRIVNHNFEHRPGTIIVSTTKRTLHYIIDKKKAWRYTVSIGRTGFGWHGRETITMKRKWPSWTPSPAMRKRKPGLPKFVKGGKDNPMGSRALYLGNTLYRIHGTNDPRFVGHAVSSGCFRMTNDDVEHLYNLARVGNRVIVKRF